MRIGQKVALGGMIVSSGLAVAKIITGLMAGSISVVADGLESAGDVLSSGLVFLGLTLAAKPADWNHPYGHGRAETLTGLLVGLMLFGTGVAISFHALLFAGESHQPPAAYAIWPLIVSIGVKSVLCGVKFRFGKKIGSTALAADGWNDAVDIVSGLAALAAVSLTLHDPQRFIAADHYGGFVVGLIVIFTGVRVTRDTGLQLERVPCTQDALLTQLQLSCSPLSPPCFSPPAAAARARQPPPTRGQTVAQQDQ